MMNKLSLSLIVTVLVVVGSISITYAGDVDVDLTVTFEDFTIQLADGGTTNSISVYKDFLDDVDPEHAGSNYIARAQEYFSPVAQKAVFITVKRWWAELQESKKQQNVDNYKQ